MKDTDIIRRIKETIRQPKVFRNVNLTRSDFARDIGISERRLSDILNNEISLDFHELLNIQRAHYAHRVLRSEVHRKDSLDDIAIFCGFVSRVTMHRYFTRVYGITPGKYRKSFAFTG